MSPESSRGPEPSQPEMPPLPDWLRDEPQATIPNAPVTGPSSPDAATAPVQIGGNVGDTQPNPTIYFGPQTETTGPVGEVKPRGVDAAKLALYGFIEARAQWLADKAEKREERLERKDEFYTTVGNMALEGIVEKPPLPDKVSERGRGIRGRGMNRANMAAAPENLMKLRFTPEEARRRKARRAAGLPIDEPEHDEIRDYTPTEPEHSNKLRYTPEQARRLKSHREKNAYGPEGETFVERNYTKKLKRRVAAYHKSNKAVRRVQVTNSGKYRPWLTRAKRLTDKKAPPVIGRSPVQQNVLRGRAAKRKRVEWPAEQQAGHMWRRQQHSLADKVRIGGDDIAYSMTKKQAEIRRAARQKQNAQS